MYTVLVVAGLCGIVERDAAVSVILHPEVNCICVHDPLIVKVVATNDSKEALPFDPPISVATGNLAFEVRHPTRRDFWPVVLSRDPCPHPAIHSRGFEAAAAFVSYDCLFRTQHGDQGASVFTEEGDWAIRAKVRVGSRIHVSKPVVVKVSSAPRVSAVLAKQACAKELRQYAWSLGLVTPREKLGDFGPLVVELKGTNAGAMIHRAVLIRDVEDAKSERERDAAVIRLVEYHKTCSSVQQEHLDLLLASAYLERKEFAAVRQQLKLVTASSACRDRIYAKLNRLDPMR